ncbi:MAG: hypothetical protein ACRD3C_18685 [Vicinamibacterales bacterium]
MQEFPKVLYNAAGNDRQVNSAAEEAELNLDEWRPHRDAFRPGWVPPPPPRPAGLKVSPHYVPQQFPKVLYNRFGQDRQVESAAEEAQLDPNEWFGMNRAPSAPAPSVSSAPPAHTESDEDQAEAERKAADAMAEKARSLHATSVEDIKKALSPATREQLEDVKLLEALSPEGPRITLIKFIDAELKALAG